MPQTVTLKAGDFYGPFTFEGAAPLGGWRTVVFQSGLFTVDDAQTSELALELVADDGSGQSPITVDTTCGRTSQSLDPGQP